MKDSEWVNEILSSFYDLHLDKVINSFMYSYSAGAASQPMR